MKANTSRFLLILVAASAVVAGTSGCKNTAHGTGEDIENMGEKIQEKTK